MERTSWIGSEYSSAQTLEYRKTIVENKDLSHLWTDYHICRKDSELNMQSLTQVDQNADPGKNK